MKDHFIIEIHPRDPEAVGPFPPMYGVKFKSADGKTMQIGWYQSADGACSELRSELGG